MYLFKRLYHSLFVPFLLILMVLMLGVLSGCVDRSGSSGSGGGGSPTVTVPAMGAGQAAAASDLPAAKAPSPQLRVGIIGNTGAGPNGPIGWANKTGLLQTELKKVGITDIKFVSFPNGPNLNEALSAGQLDVGILGDTPSIVAKASGLPTRLVNLESAGMDAWLVTKKDGPKALADLKGKKVATQQGSYMHRYLIGLLKEQGLLNDVKITHLMSVDSEAALANGSIDAYAEPVATGALLASKGYPVIDKASTHPGLSGTTVTVVSEGYLDKFPAFPQVWNTVRSEAVTDLQKNGDAYFAFQASATGYSVEVTKIAYPLSLYGGEAFPQAGLSLLEGTKKFLVEQGLAKMDFTVEAWQASRT